MPNPLPASPHHVAPEAELRGIVLTLVSAILFSGTNAAAKWVMHDVPTGELLWMRGIVALGLISLAITRAELAALRRSGQMGLHVLRVLCSSIEVFCFYWVIAHTPLADMTAIYLAAPIYVTAMAALFLRERVEWRRWAAVLAGFAGVLIAVRPSGAGLSVWALVGVGGSVLYAVSLVATRQLRGAPSTILVATQMAGLIVMSSLTALPSHSFPAWMMPTALEFALMLAIGVVSMVAFWCVNQGLRLAPASAVAPINYSSILWATAAGYLIFDDMPTFSTLLGAAIIIAAGLFIVLQRARSSRMAA